MPLKTVCRKCSDRRLMLFVTVMMAPQEKRETFALATELLKAYEAQELNEAQNKP